MADLLTVYDDDQANSFIDCTICEKRIRGDTQYKIHLTTLQHLKKEDAYAAQGAIPRPPPLPQWTDIKEYLEYLNLDEPIIGLNSLKQLPDLVTDEGKTVLKYKCRLCVVEMDLFGMVAHVVGRKHRQKYLELKRPDLVTWQDTASAQKQPGLVAKAKAAVVEKQEGWGKPEPLRRTEEKFIKFYDARVHEQPFLGQDSHRQSSLDEVMHRQPYSNENRRPYYTRERYEKYDGPNQGDAMHHPEESRHQPGDRGYLQDDYSERAKRDPRRPASQEGYEEANFGRRQFSGGDGHRVASRDYDVQENIYRDAPRNRYNDKDLRFNSAAQHPGEYQEGQMEDMMYSSYDERGPGMDAMSDHGRSFHEEERRANVRDFDRRMHSYPPRFEPRDPRAYSEEAGPAKKKRKSRFSDATAEEIALAHVRHSEDHKPGQRSQNKHREGHIRGKPPPFNNSVMDSGSTPHLNPNPENVLDVLNNIEINNLEDAQYLKQKLCTVLKDFQATKASRFGGHTSQSVSDYRGGNQMDLHRDAYDNNLRDDPDGIYSENRGFQEVRHYEDDPRNFQESRQYEDDPRAFREVRQYDDPRGPIETRHYEDDSRDYTEQFDSYPSDFPSNEARHDADDPRGFQKMRFQENTMGFPERRGFDNDPRGKSGHYEDYSRASQDGRHHPEGMRSAQEARYYDDDFKGFGNMDPGTKWDHQKRRPLQTTESFGNPSIHLQTPSLHGETRMFAGRGQQRPHQDVRQPGDELYDPFQPSSSPPPESTSSTSLNKIASTLLELVSRR